MVKTKEINSKHLHKDSRNALEIMKFKTWSNAIHNIGLNPFFVHFWTNHQKNLYLRHVKDNIASVCIDATGGLTKSLEWFK